MMKNILIVLCALGFYATATAQNVYIDKAGKASFYSKAPMEDIEAHNGQALGVIDLDNGLVAVSVLVKGFHFEKALMEEHFNENYLESDKYPKATFKGRILEFQTLDFKNPEGINATVEGEITLHGVKKILQAEVSFKPEKGKDAYRSSTTFKLKVADFKIKIPNVVVDNIAKEVDVTLDFYITKRES